MDLRIIAALGLFVGFAGRAAGQSDGGAADKAADPTDNRTSYLIVREKADPHFSCASRISCIPGIR